MRMQLKNAHILITGGAGLVGSHLTQQLLDDGATVRVVDDLSKGNKQRIPDGAEFTKADLTNKDDVDRIISEDIDFVFHLAAHTDTNYHDDRQLFEENTNMTYNILERIKQSM